MTIELLLACDAALLLLWRSGRLLAGPAVCHFLDLFRVAGALARRARHGVGSHHFRRVAKRNDPADRPAVVRRAFPGRRLVGVLSRRSQSRRRRGERLRARLRASRTRARTGAALLPRLSRRHESRTRRRRRLRLPRVVGVHVAHLLGACDGESRGSRQCARRLRLYRHGELRDVGAAAGVRPAGGPARRF